MYTQCQMSQRELRSHAEGTLVHSWYFRPWYESKWRRQVLRVVPGPSMRSFTTFCIHLLLTTLRLSVSPLPYFFLSSLPVRAGPHVFAEHVFTRLSSPGRPFRVYFHPLGFRQGHSDPTFSVQGLGRPVTLG